MHVGRLLWQRYQILIRTVLCVFCLQTLGGNLESPGDNRSTIIGAQKDASPLTVEVTPCDTRGTVTKSAVSLLYCQGCAECSSCTSFSFDLLLVYLIILQQIFANFTLIFIFHYTLDSFVQLNHKLALRKANIYILPTYFVRSGILMSIFINYCRPISYIICNIIYSFLSNCNGMHCKPARLQSAQQQKQQLQPKIRPSPKKSGPMGLKSELVRPTVAGANE